jgi:hypothetical protein
MAELPKDEPLVVRLFCFGKYSLNEARGGDTMKKTILIAALTMSLLMIPFLVHAEVYKWVDEKGTVHFTDDNSRIPEKYGQQVEKRFFSEDPKPITEEKKTESKTAGIPFSSSGVGETPLLFSGLISTVGSGTIVIKGDGKDMVFLISEDTIIKTDYGQKVSFSELKNERPVTVEYIRKGDDNHARSVTVSILQAGTTNAVEKDNDGKDITGPGKLQNPSETQKGVWESQKRFKKSIK